jgi:hypothetical protein
MPESTVNQAESAMQKFIKTAMACAVLALSGAVFAADVVDIKPEAVLERSAKGDKKLVILDVRTPEEFAQGHVPGAINIPHDKLPDRIGGSISKATCSSGPKRSGR